MEENPTADQLMKSNKWIDHLERVTGVGVSQDRNESDNQKRCDAVQTHRFTELNNI